MSLQQQLNLLRLQVGLIAVAKKLSVVLQSLPLDCRGYLELSLMSRPVLHVITDTSSALKSWFQRLLVRPDSIVVKQVLRRVCK